MRYVGNIIRPPSEANSILLQITVGCSHNKCAFCGAYKGKLFSIKSDEIIMKDIAFAANYCKRQRRVFLCDGDALIVSQKKLLRILIEIKRQLPWITRVGTYANVKSLKLKTLDELKELKANGLSIVYMGLESGDDITLKKINKGATSKSMIKMGKKLKEAGIKLSITVLLGIAGRRRSRIHSEETGRVLSSIDPEHIGALSLILIPGTPMYKDYKDGIFSIPGSYELIEELKIMFANTELSRGLFYANHASNYLPIKARLPKDKDVTIELINKALAGKIPLKHESLRAL